MSDPMPDLRVLPDADAVFAAAAEVIAQALEAGLAARGRADWATTGGSAAPPIYRHLGSGPMRERFDWARVHTWWGDDRFVPHDHPLSNVQPFEQILMSAGAGDIGLSGHRLDTGAEGPRDAPIPPANVHPFPIPAAIAESRGPDWCAARYAEELVASVPERDADGIPVLDLVVLGVGPDGHILSVFPGSAVWDDDGVATAVPAPAHVEPYVERVTLHPRIVTAARVVLLVSTGDGKADAIGQAWADGDVRRIPARTARRPGAIWLLDPGAARDLPARDIRTGAGASGSSDERD
jgi:6-phosphogluconolactonase